MLNHSSVITIITVTLNNVAGLNKTLKSISQQSYKNIELIVIDGVSIDGTKQLIESSEYKIDKLLIEPDEGTYDAMNKGLKLASGQWVLFMNSGDYFAETDSLRHAVDCINDNVDVVFSDWIYENSNSLISADISKLNVRHQSVLYRLKLHDTFGQYVVGKGVSISDYIFFLSIKHKNWKYCPTPISICDESGTSSMPQHFYQRLAAEIIFGKRTRVNGALIILLYPIYSFLKRSIFRTRH